MDSQQLSQRSHFQTHLENKGAAHENQTGSYFQRKMCITSYLPHIERYIWYISFFSDNFGKLRHCHLLRQIEQPEPEEAPFHVHLTSPHPNEQVGSLGQNL